MECDLVCPEAGKGDPKIHGLLPDTLSVTIQIGEKKSYFFNFQLNDYNLTMKFSVSLNVMVNELQSSDII